jgi:Lrp/AsnC family transcriptional regulator for asnA, asnC and gidA
MLASDGRASGRDLAQQTGISEANVSRRLARLIEERSVRIVGFVPPEVLGLEVQFAVHMRVRGSVDAAAESLLKHPEFSYVVGCFGEDDLVAYGVAENGIALSNLLDRSIRGNPLLYRVRSETVLSFAGAERATGAAPLPRTIDRTDRLIIREVQRDGRISFTDIAQRTGISATSAADRFRRLLSDGTVRILTLPDPPRVDLNLSGLMQFHLSQPISAVLPKLAAFTELAFLSACTGRVSMQCEFNVRDEAHFDELRGRLLAVSGVDYVGVNILRRIYRQSFEWGAIPAE